MGSLTGQQLEGLAQLSVATYQTGFVTAQLFFSAWLFPLGVLVWFLQVLLAPGHPAISYPAWAVGFLAEVGLGLWPLVRGVGPRASATEVPAG